MASKSLGTLTLDLIAKVGGFTAGMSEAERAAKKSADKIQASIKGIGVAGYAVGTALGGFLKDGITAAVNAFPELIEQAAQFQDIAEKTGGSAEGFASLAVSAKVGGTSMEELTAASIKLTKGLTGVDDESKAAGAALTALGIPIEDFKKLAPEQQLLKVAEALGGFAEGAGKTAVATDLFGKAGANLLPTLKDLYEQGGAQKILTDAQIKQADDYSDALTRQKAQIGLYASAIAADVLPVIVAFTGALKDLIREFVGTESAASALGASNGVAIFAENAGRELAKMVDYVTASVRELRALVDFVVTAGEIVGKALVFDKSSGLDFSAAKKAGADFRARHGLDENGMGIAGQKAAQTFVQKFDAQLSGAKRAAFAATDPRRVDVKGGKVVDSRAALVYSGTNKPGKGGGKGAADDPTKKLLDNDLKAYQAQADAAKELLADRNKILDLYNAQGLISVKDYYAQLQGNLDEATATQMKSYGDQLKALQDYQSKAGKDTDKADAQGKINDILAKQAKLQRDSGNAAVEMGIKQQQATQAYRDALNEVNAKILELDGNLGKAAEIRFDAQNRQLRELAKNSGDFASVAQIDRLREYTKAQADLNAVQAKFSLAQGDLQIAEERITQARERGTMGEIESLQASGRARREAVVVMQSQLEKLQEINNAKPSDEQRQAIDRLKLQLEGLTTTLDPLGDKINTLLGDAAGSAFSDFVQGTKTAKEALQDFASSVLRTFIDLAAKQLGKQLFSSLLGDFGGTGGAGGLGGLISGLIGGGGSDTAGYEKLIASFAGSSFTSGGFTGMGAANDPAGIVHKGEYVLNAQQTRSIGVGNLDRGNFGGTNVFNVNIPESVSRNTGSQIAAEAQRKLVMGSRNT